MARAVEETQGLESTTVAINRTATTVKGGRRMSFSALVVVGDHNGKVGVGYGKGRGVPAAIEKAQKAAKRNIFTVTQREGTLPHAVLGRFNASQIKLIPAAPGTGVIAGGTARAVLEMAGIKDVLTKVYGSTNVNNLTKAVVDGLKQLRTPEQIAELRGVEIPASDVDAMLASSRKMMQESTEVAPAKSLKEANDSIKPPEPPKPAKEEAKEEAEPVAETAEDAKAEAPAETPEASTEDTSAQAPAEDPKPEA